MIESPGGFRFLPADSPFSAGVAALPGFEIVRAIAPRYTELTEGFGLVERTLSKSGRPITALCAMELRIPKPFTPEGFADFNRGYIARLERWGLPIENRIPAARTNVAPELEPPDRPSLHAFSYTVEAGDRRKTFVISGATEPQGMGGGLPSYWDGIVGILEERMSALGVGWQDATETQFYGTRADHEVFATAGLRRMEQLVRPGLRWFFARPPIAGLRLEIDVRGLAREFWIG